MRRSTGAISRTSIVEGPGRHQRGSRCPSGPRAHVAASAEILSRVGLPPPGFLGGRRMRRRNTTCRPAALSPVPSPVRPPTPTRTGEGRHHPAPKPAGEKETLLFFGWGALSRLGRGAVARAGEGRGGGGRRGRLGLRDSAPPPTRREGASPSPTLGW